MNNTDIKVLIINNDSTEKFLPALDSIHIECINEKKLTEKFLDQMKPDVIVTAVINKKLLNWKEKSFARLIKIFDNPQNITITSQFDDFIILNQPDTHIRFEQIIKSQEQLLKLMNSSQKHYDFLSTTVHDLKTPLTSILGFAELLQEERISGELNQKQQKFVSQITNSANHLFQMVKDLLNYSIVESGRMQLEIKKQNLNDILYQISPEIAVLIKNKEINYLTSVSDHIYGYFDEERLRQVLENIISNAIKFTSKQGMIHVSASRTRHSLKITVSDTGIGIAPEDLEKVLDKEILFTTKGVHGEKGTGLGVSICAEILRAHGGKLEIESQPGEGTIVTLTLPDHDC